MPKKYEISTEAQVLLKLLRIALGTEPMASNGRPAAEEAIPASEGSTPVEPFPSDIDWREVIRLSYEQKVSSLAVDGLKASGYDIRQLAGSAALQPAFASWLDDVKNNRLLSAESKQAWPLLSIARLFEQARLRSVWRRFASVRKQTIINTSQI